MSRDSRAYVLGEQVQVIASEIVRHVCDTLRLAPDSVVVAEAIRAATAIVLAEDASMRRISDRRLDKSIRELGLQFVTTRMLEGADIWTIRTLVNRSVSQLMKIHSLGRAGIGEITDKLGEIGLRLADESE